MHIQVEPCGSIPTGMPIGLTTQCDNFFTWHGLRTCMFIQLEPCGRGTRAWAVDPCISLFHTLKTYRTWKTEVFHALTENLASPSIKLAPAHLQVRTPGPSGKKKVCWHKSTPAVSKIPIIFAVDATDSIRFDSQGMNCSIHRCSMTVHN